MSSPRNINEQGASLFAIKLALTLLDQPIDFRIAVR
jgi:hypothetical protein